MDVTRAKSLPHSRGSDGQVPYLNVGCGKHFHPAWTNLDLQARPRVIQHDLRTRLPFPEGRFEAVYHSHVLEHLPRADGLRLLQECARVLRPKGIIRVAVPDLEAIARLYIKYLDEASQGDPQAAAAYDWIVLELLDQMVRTRSGGEMLAYWKQRAMPAEVLVVDYRLPGPDGVQVTLAVRAARPDVAVVCLTAGVNPREEAALYDAGAVACVSKDGSLEEIVAAIKRAARREA